MNAEIRGAIRRVFARSPKVRQKLDESRKQVPRYKKDGSRAKKDFVHRQCEVCQEWVSASKIDVDHIDPVITQEGFIDWNTFVARVDCPIENLQRICDTCHNKKTQGERDIRNAKKDAELLKAIKDDLYTSDHLSECHKKPLKRMSKRNGDAYIDIRKEASELLANFFPKKNGRK